MASTHGYVPPSSSTVKEYMRSRCIFEKPNFAIVIDGFRYVKPFKQLLQLQEHESLSSSKAEACAEQTLLKSEGSSGADCKLVEGSVEKAAVLTHGESLSASCKTMSNEETPLLCLSQANPNVSLFDAFSAVNSIPLEKYPSSESSIATAKSTSVIKGVYAASLQPLVPTNATGSHPLVLYFLSHFHSDHYTGITPTWQHGIIYCSEGTAAMVHSQLGVSTEFLYPMKMDCTYKGRLEWGQNGAREGAGTVLMLVETEPPTSAEQAGEKEESEEARNCNAGHVLSCSSLERHAPTERDFAVRMISANHCPGAVMFLFYSPAFGGYLLHTGDFRFNGKRPTASAPALGQGLSTASHSQQGSGSGVSSSAFEEVFIGEDNLLQAISGKVKTLFLDNTFCAPTYVFPTQREVSRVVIDLITSLFRTAAEQHRRHFQTATRTSSPFSSATSSSSSRRVYHVAVLIGSYTIGKERIALEVQNAFPVKRIKAEYSSNSASGAVEVHSSPTSGSSGPSRVSSYLPILTSPSKLAMLTGMKFFASKFASWDDPVNGIPGTDPSTSPSRIDTSSSRAGQSGMETDRNLCALLGESETVSGENSKRKDKDEDDGSVFTSAVPGHILQPRLRDPVMVGPLSTASSVQPGSSSFNGSHPAFRTLVSEFDQEGEDDCSMPEAELDYHLTILLVPMASIGYVTLRDAVQPYYSSSSSSKGYGGSSRWAPRPSDECAALASGPANVGTKRPRESSTPFLRDEGQGDLHSVSNSDSTSSQKPVEQNGSSRQNSLAGLPLEKGVRLDLTAFDHLVAVEPTGFAKKIKQSRIGNFVTRISLPYSEHCSFPEMVNFVGFINPERVVPTVDVGQYKKYESFFVEKAHRLVPQYSAVPLTRMFATQQQRQQQQEQPAKPEPHGRGGGIVSSGKRVEKQPAARGSGTSVSSKASVESHPSSAAPPQNPFLHHHHHTATDAEKRKPGSKEEEHPHDHHHEESLSTVLRAPPRPPSSFLPVDQNSSVLQHKGNNSSMADGTRVMETSAAKKQRQAVLPLVPSASVLNPQASRRTRGSSPVVNPHHRCLTAGAAAVVRISLSPSRSPSTGSDGVVFMKAEKRAFSISDDEE